MTDGHGSKTPFEFSEIIPQVFIGTNQCCQSHFSEKLLSLGVTVDISLEEDHVDAPFGVESYLWIPVKDHTPPTQDQLKMGVAFLSTALMADKKVYVHCKNGHGRAPTLVAAYFLSIGKSVDETLDILSKKRPAIHFESTQKEALRFYFTATHAQ